MKKTLTMICGVSLLTVSLAFADTGLTFSVESSVKTVRVGDQIDLTLKISGSAITNLAVAPSGVEFWNPGTGAFDYNCHFTARKEGSYTFGPYTLAFNGQSLTSGTVAVQVLPKWNGEYGTLFRVDRDKIILGEKVELAQETWSPRRMEYSAAHASLKRLGGDFESSGGPSLSSFSMSKGVTNCYERQTWMLKPKKAGVFKINKELFESLPEGVTPPDLAVTVEPGGRPAATDGAPDAHDLR